MIIPTHCYKRFWTSMIWQVGYGHNIVANACLVFYLQIIFWYELMCCWYISHCMTSIVNYFCYQCDICSIIKRILIFLKSMYHNLFYVPMHIGITNHINMFQKYLVLQKWLVCLTQFFNNGCINCIFFAVVWHKIYVWYVWN